MKTLRLRPFYFFIRWLIPAQTPQNILNSRLRFSLCVRLVFLSIDVYYVLVIFFIKSSFCVIHGMTELKIMFDVAVMFHLTAKLEIPIGWDVIHVINLWIPLWDKIAVLQFVSSIYELSFAGYIEINSMLNNGLRFISFIYYAKWFADGDDCVKGCTTIKCVFFIIPRGKYW